MANTEQLLSEREVSDWLGLSEPTLFRHRRDGTGPTFIRLSARRVAYRRRAVEAWLSERERQNTANDDLAHALTLDGGGEHRRTKTAD
jgi:predicted DNA-binding transcriptional regulator AlpA